MLANKSKKQKKPEEGKVNFKKFKDLEKQKSEYFKEKEARHKEYLNEMKDKVSFKLGELPDPQPVTYATFDKYNKLYNPKEKKSKKLS